MHKLCNPVITDANEKARNNQFLGFSNLQYLIISSYKLARAGLEALMVCSDGR